MHVKMVIKSIVTNTVGIRRSITSPNKISVVFLENKLNIGKRIIRKGGMISPQFLLRTATSPFYP